MQPTPPQFGLALGLTTTRSALSCEAGESCSRLVSQNRRGPSNALCRVELARASRATAQPQGGVGSSLHAADARASPNASKLFDDGALWTDRADLRIWDVFGITCKFERALTPALSRWQREPLIPRWDVSRSHDYIPCGIAFSLSQRERAGVRENGCSRRGRLLAQQRQDVLTRRSAGSSIESSGTRRGIN